MFDTLADAVPLAQSGSRRKKAMVVISDGNDTSSRTDVEEIRQLIRETEVLVYAIGIDASGQPMSSVAAAASPRVPKRAAVPSPFPGQRAYTPPPSPPPTPATSRASNRNRGSSNDERLNVDSLRAITDDSGGRTEVIISAQDLDPATAGIADELSRQYFLGYVSTLPKDGRWHTIDVRVRGTNYTVRARRGFVAG